MSDDLSPRDRVLAVLDNATAPMTSGEIYQADDVFADTTQVSNACYHLKKAGKIMSGPGGFWLAGKPAPKVGAPVTAPPPKAVTKPPAEPAPRPAVQAADREAPVAAAMGAAQTSGVIESLDAFLASPPRREPPPPAGFDATISLDGTLTISDADASIALSSTQCARLLKFLEAHA